MTSLKNIMKNLGISSKILKSTKSIKQPDNFTNVKDNIPLIPNYNEQSDILFLPTTSDGYKYLLVITDLATNKFDFEPLKNKDAKTVLEAMNKIFKSSKYIRKPHASFSTDSGTEYKDVVDKWLYKNNIFHKTAIPGRHTQQANVESLNRVLGRVLNNYMSQKELETGKVYREWTDILPGLKKELNEYRENPNIPKSIYKYEYPNFEITGTEISDPESKAKIKTTKKKININSLFKGQTDGKIYEEHLPKFKIGQMVYRKLDKPRNILGHNQPTENFREGDIRWSVIEPRKIKRILYFNTEPYYRYILNDVPNVSYPENELKKATEKAEKYIIQSIKSKKTIKGKVCYEVKWKGYKRTTWEPRTQLIKDIPDLIQEFEANH